MAYVYKHTTRDTNEVFYIGIGKNKNYRRITSKASRNQFWKNIVNKHDYISEILFDNLTWKEACLKEIELIKFYGRRDLGLGTLVNLTDGGEGNLGSVYTEDRRNKMKIKTKIGERSSKICIEFDTGIVHNSLKEACLLYNLNYQVQRFAIKKKWSTAKFYFKGEEFIRPTKEEILKNRRIRALNNSNNLKKKIIDTRSNEIYNSVKEAANILNLKESFIRTQLRKNIENKLFDYLK